MSTAFEFPVRAFIAFVYGNMLTAMSGRIGKPQPARHYIREWMEAKGLDSKRIAERMDRSEATVSKLLSNNMKLTLTYLAEFAVALDLWTEDKHPDISRLFHDPARPTRDELLRGYSNEELTSAIQLIEHTRSIATQAENGLRSESTPVRGGKRVAIKR